jgi:hypothetical protein
VTLFKSALTLQSRRLRKRHMHSSKGFILISMKVSIHRKRSTMKRSLYKSGFLMSLLRAIGVIRGLGLIDYNVNISLILSNILKLSLRVICL